MRWLFTMEGIKDVEAVRRSPGWSRPLAGQQTDLRARRSAGHDCARSGDERKHAVDCWRRVFVCHLIAHNPAAAAAVRSVCLPPRAAPKLAPSWISMGFMVEIRYLNTFKIESSMT